MSKLKKLYLIANYSAKPKNPKMTSVKGYMSDPSNIAWDEQLGIVYGLKDKVRLSSNIILNISEGTVERNTFGNNKSFYDLFEYFYTTSPTYVTNTLRSYGIEIKKPGQQNGIDVSDKTETSAGPEPASTTDPVGPSEGIEGHTTDDRVVTESNQQSA